MPWYPRIHAAIQHVLPVLLPTQATNLALLVSALLAKRSSCLSELARAYPRTALDQRRAGPSPLLVSDHSRKQVARRALGACLTYHEDVLPFF